LYILSRGEGSGRKHDNLAIRIRKGVDSVIMSDSKTSQVETGKLHITMDSNNLQVSYVSSMLRVLQAAVRDIARGVDDAHDLFEIHPQPVLLLSTEVDGPDLQLQIFFADPTNSKPMVELSAQAFDPFMVQFGNLLKLQNGAYLSPATSWRSSSVPHIEFKSWPLTWERRPSR